MKLRDGRLKDELGNISGDKTGKQKISQEAITKIIYQIKEFLTYITKENFYHMASLTEKCMSFIWKIRAI